MELDSRLCGNDRKVYLDVLRRSQRPVAARGIRLMSESASGPVFGVVWVFEEGKTCLPPLVAAGCVDIGVGLGLF